MITLSFDIENADFEGSATGVGTDLDAAINAVFIQAAAATIELMHKPTISGGPLVQRIRDRNGNSIGTLTVDV